MIPSELLDLIQHGHPPVILDVRSAREFSAGHVPGAIHLSFLSVASGTRIPAQLNEAVVVYCGHGPRARIAGAALRRRGFQNVEYLVGHMARWRKERLPEEVLGS